MTTVRQEQNSPANPASFKSGVAARDPAGNRIGIHALQ
jgi:hypothetical protein